MGWFRFEEAVIQIEGGRDMDLRRVLFGFQRGYFCTWGGESDLRRGWFRFEEGVIQIWGVIWISEGLIQILGGGDSDLRRAWYRFEGRVIQIWGGDSDLRRGKFKFEEGMIKIWGEGDSGFRRADLDLREWFRFEQGMIRIWVGVIWIWWGDWYLMRG